jgi:hypothetical protein
MSIEQTQTEVNYAWANSYSPEGIATAVNSISRESIAHRISILIARLCFRGIYFPQMGRWAWTKVIVQNRRTIYSLAKDGLASWRAAKKTQRLLVSQRL